MPAHSLENNDTRDRGEDPPAQRLASAPVPVTAAGCVNDNTATAPGIERVLKQLSSEVRNETHLVWGAVFPVLCWPVPFTTVLNVCLLVPVCAEPRAEAGPGTERVQV